MKLYRKYAVISAAILLISVLAFTIRPIVAAEAAKSAAELEKEKALKNPYPNDLGPDNIDDIVNTEYSKDGEFTKKRPIDAKNPKKGSYTLNDGYTLLKARCAQCHSQARPLNSRFVEPEGKDAAVAALKKSNPELFKDSTVWQIEGSVWNRYVKRMMSKPGCKISSAEGKQIWEFLVYDSSKRKIGANAKKWEAHRKKLLADFKAKHPERYEELAKDKDL